VISRFARSVLWKIHAIFSKTQRRVGPYSTPSPPRPARSNGAAAIECAGVVEPFERLLLVLGEVGRVLDAALALDEIARGLAERRTSLGEAEAGHPSSDRRPWWSG
jgi:hypothetical protein